MKDTVNILFVCGYGVGSSVIAETMVRKELNFKNIKFEMKHTAVGEMGQYKEWVDIVAISKKLVEGINKSDYKDKSIIEMINIMDSKKIASDIYEIVDKYFEYAKI